MDELNNISRESEDSPVLLLWDHDMGWIVETVEDGEYEVQNLPHDGMNNDPDIELAYEIAKERQVDIWYYAKQGKLKVKITPVIKNYYEQNIG